MIKYTYIKIYFPFSSCITIPQMKQLLRLTSFISKVPKRTGCFCSHTKSCIFFITAYTNIQFSINRQKMQKAKRIGHQQKHRLIRKNNWPSPKALAHQEKLISKNNGISAKYWQILTNSNFLLLSLPRSASRSSWSTFLMM